jgi:hypothetical protein
MSLMLPPPFTYQLIKQQPLKNCSKTVQKRDSEWSKINSIERKEISLSRTWVGKPALRPPFAALNCTENDLVNLVQPLGQLRA